MLNFTTAANSCGVTLIHGDSSYQTPEAFIKDFLHTRQPGDNGYTQYMYTHNIDTRDIGLKIEQFIVRNRLGTVVRSAIGNNPVHNSKIVVWLWTLDLDGCKAYKNQLDMAAKALSDAKKAAPPANQKLMEAAKTAPVQQPAAKFPGAV